jgi:putative DNA primase/helicase
MEALRHQASLIDGVCLLIADPIVSAVSGDSHKNTEVRRALQPLVDLGAILGCAVLGISHFSKGSAGRDPVERVTGSIAFAALARIVLATAKPEEGPRVLARAKSNIGPDGGGITYAISVGDVPGHPGVTASAIEWLEAVEGSARDLLGAAEEVPDRDDEGEDVVDWLRDLLVGGVTPAKAVQAAARECGFTPKQLRRAREQLGVCARKGAGEGPTAPWYWSLPDHDKMPSTLQGAQEAQPQRLGTLGTLGEVQP